jgi:RNA polymerase sigma-70 factor (ECF subfamily)
VTAARPDPASPTIISRPATPTRPTQDDVDAIVAETWLTQRDRVLGSVLRCTRDRDVAEDIVADSFEALLREARADRLPDNPAAWLHRVARNRVVDWSRRRARWAALGLEPEGSDDDPAAAVLCRERAAELYEALATLPAAGRRGVLLEGQGYKPAEIAPLLGRTNQATRTLLCRARKRVAAELSGAVA